MRFGLIERNYDRRTRTISANQSQPVLRFLHVAVLAAAKYDEINAPFGEEKLVRLVQKLLTAKIPDVRRQLRSTRGQRHRMPLDAGRFRFSFVVLEIAQGFA